MKIEFNTGKKEMNLYQRLKRLEGINNQISALLNNQKVHIIFHYGKFFLVDCEHYQNDSMTIVKDELYQKRIVNGNGIKVQSFANLDDVPF